MRSTLAAAAAGFILLSGAAASAHAFLKVASPAVGSTVHQPPTEVSITFTQGVEPLFSTITVTNASGMNVESGAVHAAGGEAKLAVPLKPLLPGTYHVVWHATSVDTHRTQGTFSFTLLP